MVGPGGTCKSSLDVVSEPRVRLPRMALVLVCFIAQSGFNTWLFWSHPAPDSLPPPVGGRTLRELVDESLPARPSRCPAAVNAATMGDKHIVYFDLETQRSANDVGGWNRKDKMGMSIGVTFSTRSGQYRIYAEDDVLELCEQLRSADLVVGFNHTHFDLPVLQPYSMWNLADHTINLDLMVDLERTARAPPQA